MKEKTINSKNIFYGKLVQLKVLKVKLPNKKYTQREIISHPGAVAIVPILPKNRIVLVRQYRKAVEKHLLEIPAGTLNKTETPLCCAKRELIEETGYKARSLKKIMDFYPSPGYCNERIYIFKASGLIKVESCQEPDEFIKTIILSLTKIKKLIQQGEIKDAKTLIALSYFI